MSRSACFISSIDSWCSCSPSCRVPVFSAGMRKYWLIAVSSFLSEMRDNRDVACAVAPDHARQAAEVRKPEGRATRKQALCDRAFHVHTARRRHSRWRRRCRTAVARKTGHLR
jgi:hypothetical protein